MTNQNPRDTNESYQTFLGQALGYGCVWGLEGPDGWALCPSEKYDSSEVMPFWSEPEMAEVHCVDEWKDYKVVPVSLEEFIDDWLPGMHEDVYLVGINWDEDMDGEEIEPLDLLSDFDEASAE